VAGRVRAIEKSNDLIRNRTRDLPACGMVPQPTMLPCTPHRDLTVNVFICSLVTNGASSSDCIALNGGMMGWDVESSSHSLI
jgi:hypothetical protein